MGALRQRVVADGHVGPDGFDERVLGDDLVGVVDQVAQDVETFPPQRDRTRRAFKQGPAAVECQRAEPDVL